MAVGKISEKNGNNGQYCWMMFSGSSTYTPKRKYHLIWRRKISYIFQGPSGGCCEGCHMTNVQKWSKMKVVALYCTFPICLNYVLNFSHCGDMRLKNFLTAAFFFLHFSPWKQHQTKKGRCIPQKGNWHWQITDRLQKSDVDYKVYY